MKRTELPKCQCGASAGLYYSHRLERYVCPGCMEVEIIKLLAGGRFVDKLPNVPDLPAFVLVSRAEVVDCPGGFAGRPCPGKHWKGWCTHCGDDWEVYPAVKAVKDDSGT